MTIRYILRITELLKHIKEGKEFLEIGGGSLKLSSELLEHYDHCTVYEPAPKAVRYYNTIQREKRNRLRINSHYLMIVMKWIASSIY